MRVCRTCVLVFAVRPYKWAHLENIGDAWDQAPSTHVHSFLWGPQEGWGCPSSSRCEQSVLISSLLSCEVYTPRTGHAVVNEVGTAQPLPDAWGIKSRFPQAMLEVTPQILLAFGKPTRAHIDIHFDISIPDRGRCLLPVWRH